MFRSCDPFLWEHIPVERFLKNHPEGTGFVIEGYRMSSVTRAYLTEREVKSQDLVWGLVLFCFRWFPTSRPLGNAEVP